MSTTVVIAAPVPESKYAGEYFKDQFKQIGIAELVFGFVSLVFEAAAIGVYSATLGIVVIYIAPGIWCGLWFIATGGLALGSWKGATPCNVIAGMVLAILSMIACFGTAYNGGRFAANILAFGFHYVAIFHIIVMLSAIGMFITAIFHIYYASKAVRGETE